MTIYFNLVTGSPYKHLKAKVKDFIYQELFAVNVFYFDHGVQDYPVYDHHFYVVLFSGLKQTPCAPVASDSK